MSRRRILTGASLVCLLGFLIQLVYTRGFWRLGATPAPLAAPFTTEEAWVVAEIVRDITEMSAYPQSAPPTSIEPAPNAGIYRVVLGAGGPLELDLRDDLWSPAAFAALAREAFGGAQMPSRTAGNVSPVHPLLVELTPSTLVAANAAVSHALRSDIRDVAAHEAAALTLAGRPCGLREAQSNWRGWVCRLRPTGSASSIPLPWACKMGRSLATPSTWNAPRTKTSSCACTAVPSTRPPRGR